MLQGAFWEQTVVGSNPTAPTKESTALRLHLHRKVSLGMNHAPFLGFAGIAGVLHRRARDDLGRCSVVADALAHRSAVLRHRAFAMGWRRAHRVGAVATPQFICAFYLGRAWHTRTDRTTYESRGDRLLPPRA